MSDFLGYGLGKSFHFALKILSVRASANFLQWTISPTVVSGIEILGSVDFFVSPRLAIRVRPVVSFAASAGRSEEMEWLNFADCAPVTELSCD